MTTAPVDNSRFMIAESLKSPIAIVNDHGAIEWRNNAFEASFGTATPNWIHDAARVVVNSVLGVFGLWDVAAAMGLEKHDEDFGQTLG